MADVRTGLSRGQTAARLAARYGVVLALVAMVAVFSLLLPDTFFTFGTLTTIIGSQAILVIVTLGLTLTLATGEFDLSVGATLGFSMALVVILNAVAGWPLYLAMLAVLAASVAIGLVNAFFVVRIGVSAFVATLGTATVLTGLTLAITGGSVIGGLDRTLVDFARARIVGLPLIFWFGIGFAAALWYFYEHTRYGRYVYFVGEGREAARLAGLPINAIRAGAFVAAALISAVAGLLQAGVFGLEDPNIGVQYLLPAFAGAFLGAATIKVGRFNAWGSLVAIYLLVTGVTGFQLLGAESWVQQVFNGGALVAAVTLARLAGRQTT